MIINFILNEKKVQVDCDSTVRLLDILRTKFQLMSPKEGCGEGECGACAVIIEGKLINSCLVAMGSLNNAKVMTIEGYSKTKRYKVLEKTFAEAGAIQCGFCTPGMIMAAEALLSINAKPTIEEITEAISGNLCRCTGYTMIIKGIQLAAQQGEGLW